MIAWEKYPRLSGERRWKLTLADPALSPNIVILLWSPPNAVWKYGQKKKRGKKTDTRFKTQSYVYECVSVNATSV